jgi:deoxyribodipyrimidine photo-lyase
MRALVQTGWLNFLMRAMLVAIASWQLWLHWRQPALHLARCFTDYEPGIHYSQVQMQAGVTGINIPRMYSPVKQSQDQDPDVRAELEADTMRVLHLADDAPAANADVVAEAAALLGVAAPPEVAFEAAAMSAMAQEFWAENRRVRSARTQEVLGYRWRYPSYREGLRGSK